MILAVDVGNSQIFCGVFDGEELKTTFRRTSTIRASSDEFGMFFRAILRENGVDPELIDMVGICSVVPDAVHSLRNCFRKYFRVEPFLLQPGAKTGLKIRYRNPLEVGADKIANAIGALGRFPGRHLLIVDFGTATTLCAVTKDKEYLGGIIMPGIHISMVALDSQTARLPEVEIVRPSEASRPLRRREHPVGLCITALWRWFDRWPARWRGNTSQTRRRSSSGPAASDGYLKMRGCSTSLCPNSRSSGCTRSFSFHRRT